MAQPAIAELDQPAAADARQRVRQTAHDPRAGVEPISTEEALRYTGSGGLPAFAREICWIRDPDGRTGPIELFDHQDDWLHHAHLLDDRGDLHYHDVIACWGKGDGKTLMVAILLAHRLFLYPGTDHFILANSERQGAAVLFRELERLIRSSPRLMRYQPDISDARTRIRVPALGTTLEVLPCNPDTVQGYRPGPWGVFASDEVHAAQNPMAFRYLRSQCEARNALVAVSSQAGPPIADNPLWMYQQAHDAGDPEVFFSYRDRPGTRWAQAQAERDRRIYPKPIWDLFWRNAWGSRGVKLLDATDVDACIYDFDPPTTRAEIDRILLREWKTTPAASAAGLDRAMSYMRLHAGDRTVWAAVVRTTETPARYVVVQLDILGQELSDEELAAMSEEARSQAAKAEVLEAAARSRRLGIERSVLEVYQTQDLVGEIRGATVRHMSTPRKVALYNMLGQLVVGHRLAIPRAFELLREELLSITVDTSTSSTPKFEGKPHDDTVDGLVNAIDGCLPAEDAQEWGEVTAEDVVVSAGRYEAAYG